MKFFITTLGCRTNQADSAAIRAGLMQQDLEETGSHEDADLIVVNSCTVTHRTDQQVRQLTRKLRRGNPEARIVVTGCYAQRDPAALAQIEGVDAVAGNTRKDDIFEIWQASLAEATSYQSLAAIYRDDFSGVRGVDLTPATQVGGKTRPYVKIQDGCGAGCSYCVIPQVRGPSRSVPPQQILNQVVELVEIGFREIVLTGIHIGSYGMHFSPRYPLDRLLREIVEVEGIGRVRLSSIEPMELSRRIIGLAAENDTLAPHFHICLQSGSDEVLKRMRRPYNTARFGSMVEEIREKLPHAGIGTDLIVGFPGETEKEHMETVQFVEEMPFSYLHVFPYSDRPGTLATEMADKVHPEVIKSRAEELREISDLKKEDFLRQFLGQSLTVLTLTEKWGEWREGVSGNYLKVKVDGTVPGNRLIRGLICGMEGEFLHLDARESELLW